jgi:CheY-like chemotaxis protein
MKALNVLIVDDSAVARRMVRRVVELTEIDIAAVFEAGNGREALDVLDRHPIDAIITDLNMPVMSGVELLRLLNERPERPKVRVVVSTDGSDARREEAAGLQVTRYLGKPLRPEVMRDVLCELAHQFD